MPQLSLCQIRRSSMFGELLDDKLSLRERKRVRSLAIFKING